MNKEQLIEYKKEKDGYFEVHLKRRILWWNGKKLCNVRKVGGTLKKLHLEIIDGQGYVVTPFVFPDEYGCNSSEGLIFPIKESVEWIEDFKTKQALLPKEKKEDIFDTFMEEYTDFCRSENKMDWILKKLKNLSNEGQ